MKDIGSSDYSPKRSSSWAFLLLALSSTFYAACLDERDENAGGFGPAAGAGGIGGATAGGGAAGKSGAAGATAGGGAPSAGEAGEGGASEGG